MFSSFQVVTHYFPTFPTSCSTFLCLYSWTCILSSPPFPPPSTCLLLLLLPPRVYEALSLILQIRLTSDAIMVFKASRIHSHIHILGLNCSTCICSSLPSLPSFPSSYVPPPPPPPSSRLNIRRHYVHVLAFLHLSFFFIFIVLFTPRSLHSLCFDVLI